MEAQKPVPEETKNYALEALQGVMLMPWHLLRPARAHPRTTIKNIIVDILHSPTDIHLLARLRVDRQGKRNEDKEHYKNH